MGSYEQSLPFRRHLTWKCLHAEIDALHAPHPFCKGTQHRIDGKPKRRVWYNYFDSRITYEKSFLARLKYAHHNPVHHGLVHNAELYAWCSATWFARESSNAFIKTVNSFKIDRVKVYDEYDSKALSSQRTPKEGTRSPASSITNMECGGPKGCDSNSTPLLNTPSKNPVSRLPS